MMANDQGDFMKQAHHLWSMLDEMSANNPEAYQKFIEKNVNEGKEAMRPPEPNMCIQTRVSGANEDSMLFINVMDWPKVAPPKSDEDPIPICGGAMYEDEDTDYGNQQKIVSIAFHPSILQDFGFDSNRIEERRLLINLAIDFLQDQHKLKISRSYTILGFRCKGSTAKAIQTLVQNLCGPSNKEFEKELGELEQTFGPLAAGCKGSLLSQISNIGKPTDFKTTMKTNSQAEILLFPNNEKPNHAINRSGRPLIEEVLDTALQKPEYEQQIVEEGTGHSRKLILRIKLPDVKSVNECVLDISEDDLTLLVHDKYSLSLSLIEKISPDQSEAKFSRRSSCLTLTLPICF